MVLAVLALAAANAASVNAGTVGRVYNDGRDAWTLLPQKLVNRQLFEQIRSDGQSFRMGRGSR